MPNDENNNLPRLNDNNERELNENNNQNIIEIPKEYYDKLEVEKAEKLKKEQEEALQNHENKELTKNFNKNIVLILVNAIIIFTLLYATINFNEYLILGLPIYIFIFSIFYALKLKKNSNMPTSVLVGGMLIAVITFVISMIREEEMDLWTYYSIAGAITGFIGLITSNIITNILTDFKNIKALKSLGYIIFFAIIIGLPIYFYKQYPEEFYRIVFLRQTEVKAETEEEFIIKTLKSRYNLTFTCNDQKAKHQINQYSQKVTERTCTDANNRDFNVRSIAYNEGGNQYTIIDNYVDVIHLNTFKSNLQKEITSITDANTIRIYLYPEKNCTFIGDCAECDEYYASYEEEINFSNQFYNSTHLNLSKYLNVDPNTFVNEYQFKYIIDIVGNYNVFTDFNQIIDSTLNRLNNLGLKNTYGYLISVINYTSSIDHEEELYRVKGSTNNEQSFKDPEVIKLD